MNLNVSNYIKCPTYVQYKQSKTPAKEELVHNSANVTIHSDIYGFFNSSQEDGEHVSLQ